jgi:16S rRNA (guanine527-N7)-methyltransferase
VSERSIKSLEAVLRERRRLDNRPFSELEIEQLSLYYQLVLKWNPRLHLTTLSDPASFFHRHLRESELAESFLSPEVTQIWDLGTGLGVPGIPLAILRKDLLVNLVESKLHKAFFLEEVAASIRLTNLSVINARIESLNELPPFSCLVARAVEQMSDLVPLMIEFGRSGSQMLFFGSDQLMEVIRKNLPAGFDSKDYSMPDADRRFLVSLTRST